MCVTIRSASTAVNAFLYALPRWARLMFGPSVLRETSNFTCYYQALAHILVPNMTSADFSV